LDIEIHLGDEISMNWNWKY